jgi:hypothetical protein
MGSTRPEPLPYSPMERRVLAALQRLRKSVISTSALRDTIYNGRAKPFHANAAVTAILRSLIRKVERNSEAFRVKKSKPAGPYEVSYWIEKEREDECGAQQQNRGVNNG